ncbi:MAG TPA: tetratricopeptide repeat protein [Chitinophagaceae bacterium]|nr:tetratricopeptide repeat protein [Chitinophagaceae bacterium]
MKKEIILLLGIVINGGLFAQDVEQGKKYLYYHRYESAKEQFQRVLSSNPNHIDAVYWLGQTLIEDKDSLAARELYGKALAANANAALLLAGLGEVELMENKPDEARQRFETALSLTKGRNVDVIHAIARANIDATPGDANYAIERINAIPKKRRKDLKNAESYLLLGEAYRKLINGGSAVTAFRQALSMDPKLAEAQYQIGKIYVTQNNPDYFLPAFEKAVEIDPNYAPAIYELFFYWFSRDINKAKDYFNSYVAVSDRTPAIEYDRISIIYASRDYQGAIDSAKIKIDQLGDKADPRYFKLVAYSYDELKDSLNAKNYLEQYFAKQKQDAFVPEDYVFRGRILSKFPGNEAEAMSSFETAIQLDTSQQGKLKIMNDAAAFAKTTGNYNLQATWLERVYQNTKEPSNRDLYDWGYANYQAGNFQTADSIFCNLYTEKYPTEIFGYLWCARSAGAQDTTMEKGIAVEPYKRLIAFARASGEREDYKATLIQAHGYLASYYANVAKDKDSAVAYLQNILNLDPDNASATQYIEVLTKNDTKNRSAASRQKSPADTRNRKQ